MPAFVRLLAIVMAVALLGAACGDEGSGDGSGDGPVVVATTGIWADVVANVACDGLVDVKTIVPAGGDPHAFEPSLADRAAMDDADLVVANGLGLEEGLEDTIDASEGTGTAVFRVTDHVDSIPTILDNRDGESGDDEDDHGDGHDHEGDDPHIWFDPARVAGALDDLGDAVVAAAGLDADAVAACVADYRAELEAVDAEIAAMVADLPESRRKLVTSHDSMGYFADRYGFTVVGTVIPAPSTLAETSPAQLEDLAATIESAAVPAIFAEAQHSADDVEALADRIGDVAVVTLDTGSLGEPGSGADTYIGFLRTNAEAITTALG
jgi:zinc/manganese transport system substrate-binding protein